MNLTELFIFSEHNALSIDNTIVMNVPAAITDKKELFKHYCDALHFPDYFGDNWDAFEECLHDLSWLAAKTLIINHLGIPNMKLDELNVYLHILIKFVMFWHKENPFNVVVSFPIGTKTNLEQLCGGPQNKP